MNKPNTQRALVAMEAAEHSIDETYTTMCPWCNGGTAGEAKLRVTRTDAGALYICLRASCGVKGFIPFAGEHHRNTIKNPPALYRGVMTALLDSDARAFKAAYKGINPSVDAERLGWWGIAKDPDGYVFRCRDKDRCTQGFVTRSPKKRIRTYQARYSFYYPSPVLKSNRIIVVEDCISAIACASWGVKSIALLGTNLCSEALEALKGENVEIFLDPDAMPRALEWQRIHGWRCIFAEKDPKDCSNLSTILGVTE